jgi:hypothetical protein
MTDIPIWHLTKLSPEPYHYTKLPDVNVWVGIPLLQTSFAVWRDETSTLQNPAKLYLRRLQ